MSLQMALFQSFLCLSSTLWYIYHIFWIHSFADVRLSCFWVMTIMNSVAVNTGVWTYIFSDEHFVHVHHREWDRWSYGDSVFSFLRNIYTFSTETAPASIPTNGAGGFLLFADVYSPGSPGIPSGKEPACQCRGHKWCGFSSWVGGSPGEGNSNSLQYSCLENPMERGAWWATVLRGAKSQTGLKWLSISRSYNKCAVLLGKCWRTRGGFQLRTMPPNAAGTFVGMPAFGPE